MGAGLLVKGRKNSPRKAPLLKTPTQESRHPNPATRRLFLQQLAALLATPLLPGPEPLADLVHATHFESLPITIVTKSVSKPWMYEVLYGVAIIRPEFACRLLDIDEDNIIDVEAKVVFHEDALQLTSEESVGLLKE